jgi:hypothetical protein
MDRKEVEVYRYTDKEFNLHSECYEVADYTKKEGSYPNTKYFTTNNLNYVGKFQTFDDKNRITYIIFNDNGKLNKIELTETICFRVVPCRKDVEVLRIYDMSTPDFDLRNCYQIANYTRQEGTGHNIKYFTTNPLTYVGKFVEFNHNEDYTIIHIVFNDDGKIRKILVTEDLCVKLVLCRKVQVYRYTEQDFKTNSHCYEVADYTKKEGSYPDIKYFTSNKLKYVGKYQNIDDTQHHVIYLLFNDNGKINKIELTETICFRIVPCKTVNGGTKLKKQKNKKNKKQKTRKLLIR